MAVGDGNENEFGSPDICPRSSAIHLSQYNMWS